MNLIISYNNIDIYQAEHLVLKGVSMEAHEGEYAYIVGQVGSGKTSLLRTIYGELAPTGDRAEVMGNDMINIRPKNLPQLRRQIGIVFQDFRLLRDRSVHDNLDFVLCATGWKKKEERDRRIVEVLEEVGLPEKTNHRPYELSGGEQQRICIARAILNKPRLILADEPTGNLDNDNGRNIIKLLKKICDEGTTVIITTHNMQWLEETPGTVYRCENGQLVNEQTILPTVTENQLAIDDAEDVKTEQTEKVEAVAPSQLKNIDELLEDSPVKSEENSN